MPKLSSREHFVEVAGLALLVVIAAALRFTRLGAQSWWYDEAVTRQIVAGSLGHVFDALPRSESTPPLYYVATWLWRHVFGLGETGIRSFSAACGTAVVPVAWAAGRRMGSNRLAFVAAALVAVHPTLVWYSQEARAYSLLTLLGALSFFAFLRAAAEPSWRSAATWSLTCALALLTHYFAVFLIAAEAGVLLWRHPRRRQTWAACAGPAIAGLALLPLALSQERDGRTAWIAGEPMVERAGDVLRELASAGNWPVLTAQPSPEGPVWPLAVVAVAVAVVALLAVPRSGTKGGLQLAFIVAAGSVLLPFALALLGLDYFYDRNLLAAWPAVCLALAAALCTSRLGRFWPLPLAAVVAASVATSVAVAVDQHRQRDDWRGLVEAVGTMGVPRAVLVRPGFALTALQVYGMPLQPATAGTGVRELLVMGERVDGSAAPARVGAFRLVERRTVQRLGLLRYRSSGLQRLTRAALAQLGGSVLYQASDAARAWYARATAVLTTWQEAAARRGDSDLARRLARSVRDPGRLLAVPAEIPNGASLQQRISRGLEAAAAYSAAPTPMHRARLAQAVERIGAAPG